MDSAAESLPGRVSAGESLPGLWIKIDIFGPKNLGLL